MTVEWPAQKHLYRPMLDVDLDVAPTRTPAAFQLQSHVTAGNRAAGLLDPASNRGLCSRSSERTPSKSTVRTDESELNASLGVEPFGNNR